jgi:hypothetical protein
MTTHRWVARGFSDGHEVHFDADTVEACSGSGVLRAADTDGQVVLLIRGWAIAIRDDQTVMITPAPERPESSPPVRGFA